MPFTLPALFRATCSFRSGKKTLHGNVTNRLLSIFEVIGDVASLYVDAYAIAICEQKG